MIARARVMSPSSRKASATVAKELRSACQKSRAWRTKPLTHRRRPLPWASRLFSDHLVPGSGQLEAAVRSPP
jgi:hypothetical protein